MPGEASDGNDVGAMVKQLADEGPARVVRQEHSNHGLSALRLVVATTVASAERAPAGRHHGERPANARAAFAE